jgi:predicted ATPase/class 3 adenylate cyclase
MEEANSPSAGIVTLLFTDLVGSTELLHRLGDEAAEDLRRTYFDLLRKAVTAAGGREVKNLGDGLMVAFSSPVAALSCALAIQQAAAVHNDSDPIRPLRVRIGVHLGEAVEEGGDYFGRAVVVASRLCGVATGGQILASETVRAVVGDVFRFSPLARLNLKGVPEPVAAVAVAWREGDVEPPSARTAVGLPGNPLVGREADLEEVARLLGDARLVTLTGPGGIGKSRLALHVAARLETRYADGAYLCELASLTDPEPVDRAVASALRVEEGADRSTTERLVEFLASKRALLVMDNCEHVLPGATAVIAAILRGAPEVRVLATSRERLGVDGEHRVPVEALPTPIEDDPLAPAVALFADRATAVRPDFSLQGNLTAVCELCRRLDGMPLAIELAASRCVARSPAEVLAEITRRLGLADDRRIIARHRSIDSVVGWSYDHLTPSEQEVFQRVSVFAGGFTAPAAAVVVGNGAEDVVRDLTSLVERSLVGAQERGGGTRFAMLEPIRQHAEARLDGRGLLHEARARHGLWAVGWAEEADAGLRGVDDAWWNASLEEEFANLRAAHAWCRAHSPDGAVRMVAAMFFWAYGGQSEIFALADDTLERFAGNGHPLLPAVFATSALGAWRRGQLSVAEALARRGIELADGGDVARFAWTIAAGVRLFSGDFTGAIAAYDQATALARRADDLVTVVGNAGARAMCLAFAGDIDAAKTALAAVTPFVTNRSGQAWCDYIGGEIYREIDRPRALALFRRSFDGARAVGSRFVAPIASLGALSCAVRLGEPVEIEDFAELIEHWQRAGAWSQQWITVRVLIEALARNGHDEAAAVLYGGLTATKTASPIVGSDAEHLAGAVDSFQGRLGEDRFHALVGEGAALGDDGVVAHALDFVRDLA